MPITADDFRNQLLAGSVSALVQEHVFGGTPYVFRDAPGRMTLVRNHICASLPVLADNITIIGSAKTGFSLTPDTFPRPFTDASDIDVLVVDEALFDVVWHTMVAWNYPRRFSLGGADWEWVKRRREELYWGWFSPDRIRFSGLTFPHNLKPIRDLSTTWFNTFRAFGRYRELADRDISGRLYRTWKHAQLYHEAGLHQIRASLGSS